MKAEQETAPQAENITKWHILLVCVWLQTIIVYANEDITKTLTPEWGGKGLYKGLANANTLQSKGSSVHSDWWSKWLTIC